MSESFWVLPDVVGLRTPHAILKEQADALTNATNGRLEGWVENNQVNGLAAITASPVTYSRSLALSIRVPALDNYTYRILQYRQPAELYPGLISGMGGLEGVTIDNEQMFEDVLRQFLASEPTQRIVRSLLAQANDVAA